MSGYFSSFKTVFFLMIIAGTGSMKMGRNRAMLFVMLGVALLSHPGILAGREGLLSKFLERGRKSTSRDCQHCGSPRVDEPGSYNGGHGPHATWVARRPQTLELCRFLWLSHKDCSSRSSTHWRAALGRLHKACFDAPNFVSKQGCSRRFGRRTNAYCGVDVSGAEEGTSISIGYMGGKLYLTSASSECLSPFSCGEA